MAEETVPALLRSVDIDRVMSHVERVGSFDRYQASLGLRDAAAEVAEAAAAAGLTGVGIEYFTADGRPRWWSFRAPLSWTPVRAVFEVLAGPRQVLLRADQAEQPFAVATHSAATPPGGITAPLVRAPGHGPGDGLSVPPGAVVLAEGDPFARGALLEELKQAGALGFVTAAPAKGGPGPLRRGRIELPPDTSLFAFSLTPAEFAAALRAAEGGARARVVVEVDRSAAMPVVSGLLPGEESGGEVWLTAHLCHPRPGANDNASGVAALLGAARALTAARRARAAWGTRRSIRFFWGPEFTGSAAVLHRTMTGGAGHGLPDHVINLDMVGEDQELCAAPFVVERPPEHRPSLLAPLAEEVVAQVFAATAEHPGRWHASPFLGFSDHALFADPSVDRPAVQFCHPGDRFNHSAADTVDKVSRVEMLRSTAAGAALAQLLAAGGPPRAELRRIVGRWCDREEAAALRTARERGDDWGRRLLDHVRRASSAVRALALPSGAPSGGEGTVLEDGTDGDAGRATGPGVERRWSGPLNLRAMLGELPPATRSRLTGMIARDKRHLSVLFTLAIRADGTRSREQLLAETSFALRRPLPAGDTEALFDALLESGWLAETR